ncbi:MAG: UDP-N-acetylglucosamine 2-epimerase (non-hydrolyzing) [Bacteriovoracaceae bacterium]|jgi:UDP-N-acetylglucosamine 2-epimerase (non-hydrolysing)|nr:UDP-N-acetylglucosamine 2-epimerase (non-hydrolyzing) [Bacteriovoracaceae bacterium]
MKLAMLAGTRPDIIKLAPIIKECLRRNISFKLIYSNQHYSSYLSSIFFEELSLPMPDYFIDNSLPTNKQKEELAKTLKDQEIDYFMVHGDTNTALIGAMAACKTNVKIIHVEAGLRSFDLNMIEEKNRIIIDHLSNIHFTVTSVQNKNLLNENISNKSIHAVGNTIVDAVYDFLPEARRKSSILDKLKIKDSSYYLFTSHRASNVDGRNELIETLKLVESLSETTVWPIHPRTSKRIEDYKLSIPENVIILEPIGYFDFLIVLENAKLVITDSGGVQEEAYLLKTPCMTIRNSTERPETLAGDANVLVGRDIEVLQKYQSRNVHYYPDCIGDGRTAQKIIEILFSYE